MTSPIQKTTVPAYNPPAKPAPKAPEGSEAKTENVRKKVGGGCPACGMGVPAHSKG